MPYLVLEKLENRDVLQVLRLPYDIVEKYPSILGQAGGLKVKVRAYIVRAYNEEGRVVKELRSMMPLEVVDNCLKVTYLHLKEGIPVGYFIELVLINFIIPLEEGDFEVPIFPNEFRKHLSYNTPEEVRRRVEEETYALEKIGRDIEVIGLLYKAGLHSIASDLTEALERFYKHDYEGSIKFFRKVVEALRNIVQIKGIKIVSEKRTQFLREYLSKAYQLISNFGEHAGTYGFMPEANLSKDIALSACRYLVRYLESV